MWFRVLGPLEIDGDAGPVAVSGVRPRALLTALLLQPGTTVTSDRLVEALARAARHSPGVEEAPAALLWPDGEEQWRPLLPRLRARLPQLLTLGPYDSEVRTGPAIWIKCVLAGTLPEANWKSSFAAANNAAHVALGRQDTVTVLSIVLSRIYTLRNQLIHGGATWNGSVNREQLRDCVNLMGKLVPLVIEVMMDHPETLWGDAVYPVVQ